MDVWLKLGIGRGLSRSIFILHCVWKVPNRSVFGSDHCCTWEGDLKIWEEPLGSEADSSSFQLERSP